MKEIRLVIIAFMLFLVTGCHKDSENNPLNKPPTQMELWECHTQTIWHEETVFNALVGKWKWFYTQSYGLEETGRNTESENTVIEFQKDSVINVIVDGKLEASTNWGVTLTDPPLFGLTTGTIISQLLYGRILFCDDLVEFNDSYIDGDDNYFKRIE